MSSATRPIPVSCGRRVLPVDMAEPVVPKPRVESLADHARSVEGGSVSAEIDVPADIGPQKWRVDAAGASISAAAGRTGCYRIGDGAHRGCLRSGGRCHSRLKSLPACAQITHGATNVIAPNTTNPMTNATIVKPIT